MILCQPVAHLPTLLSAKKGKAKARDVVTTRKGKAATEEISFDSNESNNNDSNENDTLSMGENGYKQGGMGKGPTTI